MQNVQIVCGYTVTVIEAWSPCFWGYGVGIRDRHRWDMHSVIADQVEVVGQHQSVNLKLMYFHFPSQLAGSTIFLF